MSPHLRVPLSFLVLACAARLLMGQGASIEDTKPRFGSFLGKQPPEIKAADWLNTKKPLTLAEQKGKVVILDFWSVFCDPCIPGFRRLNELHAKFGKKGLVIIGIGREEMEVLSLAAKEHKLAFPLAADADKATFTAYDIHTLPTCYLIGSDGKVVWEGSEPEKLKDDQIEKLLSGKARGGKR